MENIWMSDDFSDVMEQTIGKDYEKFDKEWLYALKKQYFPTLSNQDDPSAKTEILFTKGFGHKPAFYSDGNDFYYTHPAYIADKSYPFIREVYVINRETFNGLGSGFIQFLTYENGQRIVLRGGMVPATMPIRLMQVKKE